MGCKSGTIAVIILSRFLRCSVFPSVYADMTIKVDWALKTNNWLPFPTVYVLQGRGARGNPLASGMHQEKRRVTSSHPERYHLISPGSQSVAIDVIVCTALHLGGQVGVGDHVGQIIWDVTRVTARGFPWESFGVRVSIFWVWINDHVQESFLFAVCSKMNYYT